MKSIQTLPGALAGNVNHTIEQAESSHVVKRLWRKDPTLWTTDEAGQKIIRNSLGWLTVPDEMIAVVNELTEFADMIRQRGFRHVMVCGMGGSSLCPEVLARTFGKQPGFPELLVLDSTDADVIAALAEKIELEHCLFVIASKSGSTTEPNAFYQYWYAELGKRRPNPGDNFIAITDPGSSLVDNAAKLGFQRTFLNQPDIGGRYSALSYFGMVPAVLMGINLAKFLERAKEAEQACSPVMPVTANPGLQLGVILGECAEAGRDKLTLVVGDEIGSLGLWIEQLIAESTGKQGKGILPVNGETLGAPSVYGDDRVFVSISVGSVADEVKAKLEALAAAGNPVLYRELRDVYDLAAEFFQWEFATACAGWRMGINPFDQPNVQEAKDATKELLNLFATKGSLPEQKVIVADDLLSIFGEGVTAGGSVVDVLRAHFATVKARDYIALLDYTEETDEIDHELQSIRMFLRDSTNCATTVGYGPRFLHSTGQLHKGGPDTGVFLQLTAADRVDFPVPGESYTFNVLKQAQALGDFRALSARGRRAIRVHLGDSTVASLRHLRSLLGQALVSKASA